MSKKAIIIIVASILAVAVLAGGIFCLVKFVFKDGEKTKTYETTTIAIEDVSGKVGDTIKVPVKMYKNPGVMAYMLNFEYDPAVLEYKGYKEGDFLTDYSFNDANGKLSFVNVEDNDVKENGTMFFLEFKILDSKSATTDIKLNLTGEDAANYNEQFVELSADNGTVTIK